MLICTVSVSVSGTDIGLGKYFEFTLLSLQFFVFWDLHITNICNLYLCRSVPSVMDISGLAAIPETPTRPPATVKPSQHVLKRPPLEGDYVSVTDSSGNRVYLRQKEDATKVKHPVCNSVTLNH